MKDEDNGNEHRDASALEEVSRILACGEVTRG